LLDTGVSAGAVLLVELSEQVGLHLPEEQDFLGHSDAKLIVLSHAAGFPLFDTLAELAFLSM